MKSAASISPLFKTFYRGLMVTLLLQEREILPNASLGHSIPMETWLPPLELLLLHGKKQIIIG
jgi:hypothetical protein